MTDLPDVYAARECNGLCYKDDSCQCAEFTAVDPNGVKRIIGIAHWRPVCFFYDYTTGKTEQLPFDGKLSFRVDWNAESAFLCPEADDDPR